MVHLTQASDKTATADVLVVARCHDARRRAPAACQNSYRTKVVIMPASTRVTGSIVEPSGYPGVPGSEVLDEMADSQAMLLAVPAPAGPSMRPT